MFFLCFLVIFLSYTMSCPGLDLQTRISWSGVHLRPPWWCLLLWLGALVSTPTHAGCASEDRTAGIPGLGSKNMLGVSARRSHTQAAQCKVVMPPDGSVTRCLVCPAAADGSGPALCLPDCSTTEAASHSPTSTLLGGDRTLPLSLRVPGRRPSPPPGTCHQVKGCSLSRGW